MPVGPVISLGQRRSSLAGLGPAETFHKFLSPFQVEKFTYMFNALFDLDKNELIETSDMAALGEKMREYSGWSKTDDTYQAILDVEYVFLECLQDQVKKESKSDASGMESSNWDQAVAAKEPSVSAITLTQWLNMWGRLTYGSAGLSDFPCWVQMLPGLFFKVIDQDKDGVLSQEEYRKFYRDFVGIDAAQLDKVTQEGYRALTAGGDYKLTPENFNFCFANFLLGRSIYGPGKYIFGVFDNRDIDEKYQVIYDDGDDGEE